MTRYDMDGKVALVAGATSGIGKVTASVDGETALTAELTFMIG